MVWNLPNLLSTLRILLSPVFIWLILSDSPFTIAIAIALFFIAAITDFFDGWFARRYKDVTAWGAFFDPLADKVLTNSALIAFAMKQWIPLWMVLIVIFRDIMVTLLRLYADSVGYVIQTRRSAKWKTLLQMLFILYTLVLYFALHTLTPPPDWLPALFTPPTLTMVFAIITLLTLYTAVEYMVTNRELFLHLWTTHIRHWLSLSAITKLWLSVFGIGFIPVLPGSIASALTLLLWIAIADVIPSIGLWGLWLLISLLSLIAIRKHNLQNTDPSWVVIDEVSGMLLTVLLLPDLSLLWLGLAFLLFRIVDIWKPFPIHLMERISIVGILLDDLAAALFAALGTYGAVQLLG